MHRAALLFPLLALSACAAPSPARSSPDVAAGSGAQPAPLEVAVTVDDLPIHGPSFAGIDRLAIADRILAAFRAHHMPPVYGFVNAQRVDEDPTLMTILQHWLAAGNPLGNHTYSHPNLNDLTVPAYLSDLEKGEAILKQLQPASEATWRVFRYPFLAEGATLEKRDAVRRYLGEHHYAVAEVTLDGADWAWNAPFARCSDRHDPAALAELRRGYVATHVNELRYERELTRKIAGRDVRHVLLLHIGAADADAMDALLTAYEKEGVRWIDLQTALADPFYADDPREASASGSALSFPLARSRGIAIPHAPARDAQAALPQTCQ